MTVLAAVRQRKARWIAEPVGCAVDDFGDHGERAHRARAHARREQQIGKIGRAVAQKLTGWGLRILACDPFFEKSRVDALRVQLVGLNTILEESDFITLHCPLLPETHHLIDDQGSTDAPFPAAVDVAAAVTRLNTP